MEFEIGAILDGKVTGVTKFGAFVSLPGGRSGLVHISEVAYSYVSDVSEFLAVGQEVKVKLISIDDNNRINLSIKQTLPPPQRQERGQRRAGNDRPQRPQGDRPQRPQGERPRFNRDNREGRDHRDGREGNDRPQRPQGERPQNRSFNNAPARTAPKEPQSFEDMMKRYMTESESRQSELNRGSRGGRGNRRRGGGNRGGNSSYDY